MALISRPARSRKTSRPKAAPERKPERKNAPGNSYRPERRSWSLPKLPLPRLPGLPGLGGTLGWLGITTLGLVLVAAVTVGLLYGYRYLTISSYFAVKTIEVQGNFRLSSREVLDIAELAPGKNALSISIDAMERKISRNPWVASVSVKRSLPDAFQITITEKEPQFWIQRDGVLYYADARGTPIAAVVPGTFASFPTLEVEHGGEDMAQRLPELVRSLSEARLSVSMLSVSLVRLSPGRGVEVFLDNSRLVLSIGQEEWIQNLERLAATLADLGRRGELKQIREVRVHGASVWVIKDGPVSAAGLYGWKENHNG